MYDIPQDSASLIKALDERERPVIADCHSILTEEGRLDLARRIGRREIVNELKFALARKE